jgi:hypothetical protein
VTVSEAREIDFTDESSFNGGSPGESRL